MSHTFNFSRRLYRQGGGNCLCKGRTLNVKENDIHITDVNVAPMLTGICNTCNGCVTGYLFENPITSYNFKCRELGLPTVTTTILPTKAEIDSVNEQHLCWQYRIGGEIYNNAVKIIQ